MPGTGRHERGFALLMVLWTLMLLAFIATVFGNNARTEVLLARNLVANARAEALADAGVFRAAAGLSILPSEGGFRGDGQVYIWRPTSGDADGNGGDEGAFTDGMEVRFTVRDEGGKVDLNQAPPALLRELLVTVGLTRDASTALADAIVDFRDEDHDKQPEGAEAREYKQARLSWGTKNEPFALVEELVYVLGMTPEIYRRIAPLVTVWGLNESPHPYTAPPEVLQALASARRAPRGRGNTAGSGAAGPSSARTPDVEPRVDPSGSSLGSRSGFGSNSGSGSSLFGQSRSGFGSGSSSGSGSSLFDQSRSGFGSGSRSGSGSGSGSGSRSGSSLLDPSRSGFGSGFRSGGGSGFGTGFSDADDQGAIDDGAEPDLEQQERSGGATFTVHAEGRLEDGTVFVREATISMTATDTEPLSIRAWRQGERILFPGGTASGG